MRFAATILFGAAIAACSGPNSGLNTLQFASAALPFPTDYQVEAARVVRDRGGDLGNVLVSYPQQTIGAGVAGPRRWYSCLRGMPAPVSSTSLPLALEMAAEWMSQQPSENRYDVVLVFSSENRRPSVRAGTDSPLCRDAAYEPITAELPVI